MPRTELTSSVAVRHLPEQSDPQAGQHAFAYTITIRNSGDVAAQLIALFLRFLQLLLDRFRFFKRLQLVVEHGLLACGGRLRRAARWAWRRRADPTLKLF